MDGMIYASTEFKFDLPKIEYPYGYPDFDGLDQPTSDYIMKFKDFREIKRFGSYDFIEGFLSLINLYVPKDDWNSLLSDKGLEIWGKVSMSILV